MKNLKLIINNDLKRERKSFLKKELMLLNLYAKRYLMVLEKTILFRLVQEISFDVYQESEKPVLRILKNLKPNYYNEKFLIKDKNVIKKIENLVQLIDKTSWNNLKLVK